MTKNPPTSKNPPMTKNAPQNMTEQQQKWFASVRDGLQRETGKSLVEWVKIAKTCPETKPRARLKWFKDVHGLRQNRAMMVIREAFPSVGWDQPAQLKDALWVDPQSRAILVAVEQLVLALPNVIAGQRKGFSAWSRRYQFAAMRPASGGVARLGLALPPESDPMLLPARKESWSERLKAVAILDSPRAANQRVAALLKAAWAAS